MGCFLLARLRLFIPLILLLLLVSFVSADVFDSNFSDGVFNNTFLNGSDVVLLNLSGGFFNGSFVSEVFAPIDISDWKNISWTSGGCYGCELSSDKTVESFLGGIDMTNNILLFHFNNDSVFGENDSYVYDFSGSGNVGFGVGFDGDEVSSNGYFGGCFDFDGVDDYLSVNVSDFDSDARFSVSFWFNADVWNVYGVSSSILSKTDNSDGWAVGNRYIDGAKLRFLSNHGNIKSVSDFVTGVWYHVVIVQEDADNAYIYVNGELDNSGDNGWVSHDSTPLIVGNDEPSNGFEFNGRVDEVAIFDTNLSASEVRSIYERGVLRLNLSVRSCDDVNCSGENFSVVDCFSSQNLSVVNNSFFQYKFDFFTVDINFSPSLYNVSVGYELVNYPPSVPTSIFCNGVFCNQSFNGTVNISANGSVDVDNDTLTYEVSFGNGTLLGTHLVGGSVSFSSLVNVSNVSLRVRTVDLSGSGVYSDYFNVSGFFYVILPVPVVPNGSGVGTSRIVPVSDLVVFADPLDLSKKFCSLSFSPEVIVLDNDFVVSSFVVTSREGFVLVPEFVVEIIDGSLGGDILVSEGVVLPGLQQSFTVRYEPSVFNAGAHFSGYLNVVIPECFTVGIPLVAGIDDVDSVWVRLLSFLQRPVIGGFGLLHIVLFWFFVWLSVLAYPFVVSLRDDRVAVYASLVFLWLFLLFVSVWLTFLLGGGFQ